MDSGIECQVKEDLRSLMAGFLNVLASLARYPDVVKVLQRAQRGSAAAVLDAEIAACRTRGLLKA